MMFTGSGSWCGAYGEMFLRWVRPIGIRDRPTSPRAHHGKMPMPNGWLDRSAGNALTISRHSANAICVHAGRESAFKCDSEK
jgi:hypothetical protein